MSGLGIDEWAEGAPLWVELEVALRQSGQGAEILLWFQGESDAVKGGEFITSYESKLSDLIVRVRRAAGSPGMLVIVFGLVDYPAGHVAFESIRRAQRSVVSRDPRAIWVTTSGLPTDGQHLTEAGYLALGRSVANVVLTRGLSRSGVPSE